MILKGLARLVVITILLILTPGIAYAAIPISDGFDYPVGIPDGSGYTVTLDFGELYEPAGGDKPHLGEDWDIISSPDIEFPVYSISNGVVRTAACGGTGWGYYIIIDHKLLDNSIISSMYAHLKIDSFETFNIYNGKNVSRGEQIGSIGATSESNGVSWAPHLHFEIRNDSSLGVEYGYAYDSTGWLEPTNRNGDTNGFIDSHRPQITPLIGDWDNNNIDTTGTFDPRTSMFSLGDDAPLQFGLPGDFPIIGDWNGDGTDTIGVYRPRTAQFFLDDNNDREPDCGTYVNCDPENPFFNFGEIGDFPLVGDWDGNGIDTIGVYRSEMARFFLDNDNDGAADENINYGASNMHDFPIIGDWDNNGRDDIGVFRRFDNECGHQLNAVFYLQGVTEECEGILFGSNEHIPITGKPNIDGLTRIGVYIPSTGVFEYRSEPVVPSMPTPGGPDDFGYTFKDSNTPDGPTYDWIEISGTGTEVLSNSDDSWVGNIGLGFFFNYYGTDYSQLAISNNGLLFSGGTTWEYVNEPITQSPSVHGFIAPFWDDIITYDSRGAGTIYYQTLGTAPNRMFIVEWYDNKHYYNSDSGVTFEAILYEGTNNIKFQYKDIYFGNVYSAVSGDNPPYDNGGSATVGIEGPTGDVGLQYSFNEQVIESDLSILFKFPQYAGTNLYLSKQAPASKDYGSTMTYSLYYHNFGDTSAQEVVLEDNLPAEVEFESASDGGTYNPVTRTVTWNIGELGPSNHDYRTISVSIPQSVLIGTVIQNDASISTSTLEVRYDDNDAHAQTTVTGSALPPDVSVEPNNGGGDIPSVYWGTPTTFSYHSCDTATGVDVSIHINDVGDDITGSMAGGPPDWTYTTTFYPRHGLATITYTVHGCTEETVSFNIYIDPAGYIYDADTSERIAGATVWLQWPDGEGGWENVPTGENPAIAQPDVNPQITGEDGQYQWDVLAGSYRVHVEAPGYDPADSIVVSIPPPVTDLHVGLTRIPSENLPPVATDDTANTNEDTTITIDVAANDNDVDGNLDPSTAAVISGPSHGTAVGNSDDTITYTPNPNYFGSDSFTYEICDTEGACDTATVTINVNSVNDPAVVSVDQDSQNVQYSDGITAITISAADIDSSSLTLSTSWVKDSGTPEPDLPADLSQSPGSCNSDGSSVTCTWTLEGQALVDAGSYDITFIVSDGVDDSEESGIIIVEPEDAACTLNSENQVAIQVAEPGGNSGSFSLKVDVTEALPDLSDDLQTTYPGDINLAEVSMNLVPVGPGSNVTPMSQCTGVVGGTGYDATNIFSCDFNDAEVNTYSVQVTVDGGYYTGSGEDVLVIYDPSLGYTTGGGTFMWPGTDEKTNFGYTMMYNKKYTNIKGNLLLVRHLPNGTIYRVKGNALYGLAIGELTDNDETYGWAAFSGKANYLEPGWLEPIGNHEFIIYVEDRDERGNGLDRFWIKIKDPNGITIDYMSMNDPAADNYVELDGGNIIVPHNKES